MFPPRQANASLYWLLAVLGIYVLSVGPALKFSGSFIEFPKEPVATIWKPVMALDHTVASPAYRAYLKIWGVGSVAWAR